MICRRPEEAIRVAEEAGVGRGPDCLIASLASAGGCCCGGDSNGGERGLLFCMEMCYIFLLSSRGCWGKMMQVTAIGFKLIISEGLEGLTL